MPALYDPEYENACREADRIALQFGEARYVVFDEEAPAGRFGHWRILTAQEAETIFAEIDHSADPVRLRRAHEARVRRAAETAMREAA